ncbi:hypothetical protein MMC18_009024 [Xylographa bjoerkii]|nr:hypothetical protein [Xylographa bjoerkii]
MQASEVRFLDRQPWRAIYVVYAIAATLSYTTLNAVRFIPPQLRQHQSWTYRQAVMNELLRCTLYYIAAIRLRTPLTLMPEAERDRFVTIAPASQSLYEGIAVNPEIQPTTIGATWYPKPYRTGDASSTVVLHLHGGAYTMGQGRNADCGYGSSLLTSRSTTRVLAPNYRLSSSPQCHFPAALQDAIATYHHLLSIGIPASQIALSGDSAGGNLAIALLRYVADHQTLLPWPAAVLLWSPWVNVDCGIGAASFDSNANSKTDYISSLFADWGVTTFVPDDMQASDPYISPLRHPFACKTALWIQVGGLEILHDVVVEFAQRMKDVSGNKVQLHVEPHVNHDIFLIGDKLGFGKEASRCADLACSFLDENGFVSRI